MARQCRERLADALPRLADAALPLHRLIFTYKYPHALYTL
jgi:hypothetical protein